MKRNGKTITAFKKYILFICIFFCRKYISYPIDYIVLSVLKSSISPFEQKKKFLKFG